MATNFWSQGERLWRYRQQKTVFCSGLWFQRYDAYKYSLHVKPRAMEYTQGKKKHAAVSACTNKNYVSDTHSKRTKRQLEFLEPARPICHLCQGSHTHISSPREWKNEHAQRYVLSIGMSADSLVCRPCRQDVTRVVTDPGHTPRWGRDVGTRLKNLCSVLNCTKIAFAHATISTGELPQGIQFRTKPIPAPTPPCKHHYHAVYDAQDTRQRNCRTCGRRLRLGSDRPCPHPEVVQAYLHETTDFTGDIAKSDRVCLTCYKSHLALTKQTDCASRDDDLRPLVESVRGGVSTGHDIIGTATNKMLMDVGEMLLENNATLLPTVCASFHHYATELAVEHGIEEPPELKLVNSRWILCEIKAKYQHHFACVCKVRKYGTLVYRPTSDIHALLSEALWKIKNSKLGRSEAKDEHVAPAPDMTDTISIGHMNRLIHTQIESSVGQGQDYDELNVDEQITKVDPYLWNALCSITRSKSEICDTDVYHIGLPLVSQSANKEVLVQVSPINSKEMKFVNLSALHAALGNDPDLAGLEAVNLPRYCRLSSYVQDVTTSHSFME